MIIRVNKKKILIIPWTFTCGGGSERILNNILSEFKNEEFDIDIFEIERGEKVNYIENLSNVNYLYTKKKNSDSILDKVSRKIKFSILKYFPSLIKCIYLKDKYDIVISFNYLYPSFLAAKFKGKKLMWVHGTIENLNYNKYTFLSRINKKILFNLQRKAFKKANKIVCIANNTKKSVEDLYLDFKSKLVILKNGYDIENIRKDSMENLDLEECDLIAVGRLDENKNFSMLIDAIKYVVKDIPNIKLSIVGEGEDRNHLEKKIDEYKLNNNINLLGYKENVYPYIKNSKLLILTSIVEGFPTVIVEGMILGKPFISTKVGGVDELSNLGDCGLIIKDAEELYNEIIHMIQDENLYRKMQGKCIEASYKYTLENQKNEIMKLIMEN